jgi:hypothetical protein
MKLFKYTMLISAVCAAFTMQSAKADSMSTLDNPGGTGLTGPFGTVDVHLDSNTMATITFKSNTAGGYFFIDNDAASVQVNAATFTEAIVTDAAFDTFQFGDNVNGFGTLNLNIRNSDGTGSQVSLISFTVTNTSGTWASANDVLTLNAGGGDGQVDAAAHVSFNNGVVTGFVGETGPFTNVPDSGMTATLLGLGLACLSGLRARFGRK